MWKRRWALIFLAVSALRIASTYTTFSEGIDEPIHLASGLQIFQEHRYLMQPGNPPLPRFCFALGPWLDGVRLEAFDMRIHLHPQFVFQSGRGYRRTLVLARIGNLIFFLIAALAAWSWARREAGEGAGLATMFLFTTQPVILGWSGLITQDMAATAGVAAGIVALMRWLERPTTLRAFVAGAAYGLAIACKFSCIPYLPVACIAILLVRRPPIAWRTVVVMPLGTALAIWAAYGFSIGELSPWFHLGTPVPAPRFIEGLVTMISINRTGIPSFLFGKTSTTGWWWYFPAAIGLKTTLPFLILLIAGVFVRPGRAFVEAIAAAAAMLAVAMTSPLDVGIRYVLPVFVPLSVAGGMALVSALGTRHAAPRVVAAVMMCWQVAVSAAAHPDYFPYFNALAGKDPSRYLG